MSLRSSLAPILLVAVLGSTACGTSDTAPSDAAGAATYEVADASRAAEAGPIDASPEVQGTDAGHDPASDGDTSDARDEGDVLVEAERADANDAHDDGDTGAVADDAAESGGLPSE